MRSISQYAIWLSLLFLIPVYSHTLAIENVPPKLDNPITADYIKKNISKKHPRLILTPKLEKDLKKKLKSDPFVQAYYQYLQNEAAKILEEPLLKRELIGFRLLSVSRRMAERMGVLCMVYRMDKDPEILTRINEELQAVCAFLTGIHNISLISRRCLLPLPWHSIGLVMFCQDKRSILPNPP